MGGSRPVRSGMRSRTTRPPGDHTTPSPDPSRGPPQPRSALRMNPPARGRTALADPPPTTPRNSPPTPPRTPPLEIHGGVPHGREGVVEPALVGLASRVRSAPIMLEPSVLVESAAEGTRATHPLATARDHVGARVREPVTREDEGHEHSEDERLDRVRRAAVARAHALAHRHGRGGQGTGGGGGGARTAHRREGGVGACAGSVEGAASADGEGVLTGGA